MNSQFDGKVALVTGGSSGIGLATAKLFARRGATVYITGRRQKELDEAVREIGQSATGIQGDVSRLGDIDKVYQTIREQNGKLDILFANAGIGEFAPLGQIKEEHFDKQFDVNVKGTLFTVQGALPLMSPGSAIVLNASLVSIKGNPAFSVYSATKAALRSFARNWAVDLKGKGIRVNAVSPGVIPTPGYHTSLGMTEQQLDDYIRSVTPAIPLGRTGTTDEVAKLFTPDAGCTWLLTEIDPENPDIAFGLCDLGMGFPELGSVSLAELGALRGGLGLAVERDLSFKPVKKLSEYADEARGLERIKA